MQQTSKHFLRWLMGLTMILRCFVIALLVHVAVLFVLATIKVGGMAAKALSAAFDGATPPPPVSQQDPDPFAALRDVDYDPPGVKGPTPPKDMMYKVGISQPSAATPSDSQVAEVIGVMSDSATAVARLQGTAGAISAPNFGTADGAGLMGVIGGTGKGPWNQRFGAQKTINIAKNKGTQEAERAVLAALRWLKEHQESDGSWSCDESIPAGTALALLAFLGHGHTTDDKEFGGTVNRGFVFLINQVDSNGLISSLGKGKHDGPQMYALGAVGLALAEGYGMTQSKALREPLERVVNAIVLSQKAAKGNPLHVGGWQYAPTSDKSDVSVSGWLIMALKSAKLAGIDVPQPAFDAAAKFVGNMYNAESGRFGYENPGQCSDNSNGSGTTGVGVLCLQFLGHGRDPRLRKSLDHLRTVKFNWDESNDFFQLYKWYYVTQAMFQGGGDYWTYWNNQFRDRLIKAQDADGHWGLPTKTTEEGNWVKSPVYSTTLSCLMLEVYYRYSPLYQEMEKGARMQPLATK